MHQCVTTVLHHAAVIGYPPGMKLDPRYFPLVLDVVDEGIFTVDRKGRITSFNRAAEAITGHRQSRDRSRRESWLEEIPGLGPKRRRELLKAFGGLQGVRQASVEDLAKVHGISRQLAEEIYERMNPGP